MTGAEVIIRGSNALNLPSKVARTSITTADVAIDYQHGVLGMFIDGTYSGAIVVGFDNRYNPIIRDPETSNVWYGTRTPDMVTALKQWVDIYNINIVG